MKITVNDRICRRAVLRFVREIRDRLSFTPTVRTVRDSPDVAFPGDAARVLLIEWAEAEPDEFDTVTRLGAEDSVQSTTIKHYERMIRTLATNAEAARALLDSAAGRQGRTGHGPDDHR
jgi:hypothetical protein